MAPKLYIEHGSPCCRTVMITAKAIGLDLDIKLVDSAKGEHLTPAFLKLNPQHTVPTLDDNGNVMWDSHAIASYLVGKYSKNNSLYPKDLYKRALVDQRLHFECALLYPQLRIIDSGYLKKEIKQPSPKMIEDVKEVYGHLEKFLEGKQWVVLDHLTVADFSIYPTIVSLNEHVALDPQEHPSILKWIERVKALPCLQGDEEEQKAFDDFVKMIRQL